jgi:single-strand selective monofunctional uracil DNA glycosylase
MCQVFAPKKIFHFSGFFDCSEFKDNAFRGLTWGRGGAQDAGMDMLQAARALIADLEGLRFEAPVTHVYNPLEYAWEAHAQYLGRYATPPKEVVLLGMNPGPFGMAQTGVPFGEVAAVREWLGIEAAVGQPANLHPKRPIQGFACHRSEVSGRRVWGWAQETFGSPERFFSRFFVANYCPLCFMESTGRNRTPDKLPSAEREALYAACDRHLRRVVEHLRPRMVVGIGAFAETRALEALENSDVPVGRVSHPSPANPKANRGWAALIAQELKALGIEVGLKGQE